MRFNFGAMLRGLSTTVAFGSLAMGCASTAPSQQLAAARSTYQQAAMSRAADDAPAELLTAKQALDQAEKAHKDDPGSGWEKHYAYLAERQAKLAMAQADIVTSERAKAQAERDYIAYQDQTRRQLEDQLQRAQSEIEDVRRQMISQQTSGEIQQLRQRQNELEMRRTELESQLSGKSSELTAERAAREQAEQRASAALEGLKDVGSVKTGNQGETIVTLPGSVLFQSADEKILPTARERLSVVADVLKEQKNKVIVVEGHADARGPASRNDELSLMRAESVREYLINQGVEPNRVKAVGRGEREPIANNSTPEGRANNRRVEIIIQNVEAAGTAGAAGG